MSDFLKSLVARQLGEAPSVRPRLAGRFEPPPDAFAPEATRRANEFEEPDAGARELFLEVETHATPARDKATHDRREDARTHERRRDADETHARVVYVKEPREESRPVPSRERSASQDSERTHDTPTQMNVTDSRARTREHDDEDDAHVRPQSVVPASGEETGLVRPDARTAARSPFVTRARSRVEQDEASPREPREPSGREADEVKRPSNVIRPAPPSSHERREAAAAPRAHEEGSSLLRNEPARAREREGQREDAYESHASLQVRRARESADAIGPRPARRRERQAVARDARRERAEATPTINVTIGRVEVRATQTPAPAERRAETAAPRMSLDDYLRRRNGEVRE